MDKTNEFLELYNDLDYLLRKKYNDQIRTNSVVIRYSNELNRSGNPNLIKIAKKLNMIRVLRNNLIHDYDNNIDNFIIISDEAISFLRYIVDVLRNPRTAKDIYTPIASLYVLKEKDNLKVVDVMKEMRVRGHSQVPVVDEFNIVKGVFSPNALFSYLEKNPSAVVDNLYLEDLKAYIALNNHFSESYTFISSKMPETDVDNLFASSYEKNRKLAVAFVTRTGKERESLLGIIVAGDIIKN